MTGGSSGIGQAAAQQLAHKVPPHTPLVDAETRTRGDSAPSLTEARGAWWGVCGRVLRWCWRVGVWPKEPPQQTSSTAAYPH